MDEFGREIAVLGPTWIAVVGVLALLELTLAIVAIVDILKKPGPLAGMKLVWLLVSAFLNFVGPIVYFAYGRGTLTPKATDSVPAASPDTAASAVDALYGPTDPPADV